MADETRESPKGKAAGDAPEAGKEPRPKGRRKALFSPQGWAIFAAAIILEGTLLFIGLSLFKQRTGETQAKETKADVGWVFAERSWVRVDLGKISVFNEDPGGPGTDRRYTAQFVVRMDQETYRKLEENSRAMPDGGPMADVTDEMKRTIRNLMQSYGGQLKKDSIRMHFPDRLREALNEQVMGKLGGEILDVFMDDFKPMPY